MPPAEKSPQSLELTPWAGRVDFAVGLPGSKSLTLRDCAIAALADGESTIRFPGECDDYWRMKDCLRRLGIAVDDSESEVVRIAGQNGAFKGGTIELFTGQSAVSTRLREAIFQDYSLREGLSSERIERYRAASHLAFHYTGFLENRYLRRSELPGLLAEARRFYRLGQREKLERIAALQ